jgi:multiple sugar transport system permease protein
MTTSTRTVPPAASVMAENRLSNQKLFQMGLSYLGLALGAVIFLVPFIWTIFTALKSSAEISSTTVTILPKGEWHWENFSKVFTNPGVDFPRYLLNTIFVIAGILIGKVISCTLVGYGFARFRAPGKNILFIAMLSTMLLPSYVTLVPTYLLFTQVFHWGDTFLPLIVPHFFGEAFYIFLMRQFFMGLPYELEEAATIDGAGRFRIFIQIMLPMVTPAVVAMCVLTFMGAWNDYFTPLIYLNDPSKYTLALGLQFLRDNTIGVSNSGSVSQLNVLMAGALVMIIPMLLIFFIAQKYIIEGVSLTGLTGR